MPKRRADLTLIRDLHAVFRDVHTHGQRALTEGNLKAFGEAIAVERSLIQEQRQAIDARIKDMQDQRAARARATPSAGSTPKRRS